MTQYGFFFYQSRCTGCRDCSVACKNWHQLPPGPLKYLKVFEYEKGSFPTVRIHFQFLIQSYTNNHEDEPKQYRRFLDISQYHVDYAASDKQKQHLFSKNTQCNRNSAALFSIWDFVKPLSWFFFRKTTNSTNIVQVKFLGQLLHLMYKNTRRMLSPAGIPLPV